MLNEQENCATFMQKCQYTPLASFMVVFTSLFDTCTKDSKERPIKNFVGCLPCHNQAAKNGKNFQN